MLSLLLYNFRPINESIPIQGMFGSCTHGMQMNGGLKMLILVVQACSQLAKFLDKVIVIQIFAVPSDENAMTDTGLVSVRPIAT